MNEFQKIFPEQKKSDINEVLIHRTRSEEVMWTEEKRMSPILALESKVRSACFQIKEKMIQKESERKHPEE